MEESESDQEKRPEQGTFKEQLRLQKYSERTVNEYDRYFELFAKETTNGEVTQDAINIFIINNNNQMARAMLKRYLDWTNQDRDFKIPKIRGREGSKENQIKPLKLEDIQRFANEAANKNLSSALLIILGFQTGLRISEILNLIPENISFPELLVRGTGKNRVVFEQAITQEVADIIVNICDLKHEGDRIWPFNRHTAWKRLNKLSLKIFQRPFHPHLLRHSCGSFLNENGFGIDEIAMYLNHEWVNQGIVTMRYAHKDRIKVVDKVRNLMKENF